MGFSWAQSSSALSSAAWSGLSAAGKCRNPSSTSCCAMAGMEAGSGANSIAVDLMASVCAGVGVVAVLVLHRPAASAPSRRRAAREDILPSCLALLQSIHRLGLAASDRVILRCESS